MAGRPRSRTDAELFAATMRAIGRDGPARLTLASVAREAGLAPSTVAERFGSKRALLLAAAEHAAGDATAGLESARRRHPEPRDAAVEWLAGATRGVRTRRALANHLAFLALDVADPQFRAAAARHAAARRAALERLLGDAALARAVEVAYNGSLITWAVSGTGTLAESVRRDLRAVLSG